MYVRPNGPKENIFEKHFCIVKRSLISPKRVKSIPSPYIYHIHSLTNLESSCIKFTNVTWHMLLGYDIHCTMYLHYTIELFLRSQDRMYSVPASWATNRLWFHYSKPLQVWLTRRKIKLGPNLMNLSYVAELPTNIRG